MVGFVVKVLPVACHVDLFHILYRSLGVVLVYIDVPDLKPYRFYSNGFAVLRRPVLVVVVVLLVAGAAVVVVCLRCGLFRINV